MPRVAHSLVSVSNSFSLLMVHSKQLWSSLQLFRGSIAILLILGYTCRRKRSTDTNMKEIGELFSRQMTRKEFLQLLGAALLSFVGIANFIASLRSQSSQPRGEVAKTAGRGFGSSKFGI